MCEDPDYFKRVRLPQPATNLHLSRQMMEDEIRHFFVRGEKKMEDIPAAFAKNVETMDRLYARRRDEIRTEMKTVLKDFLDSEELARAHDLTRELDKLNQEAPFLWIAKLYGEAVRDHLESSQRRIGSRPIYDSSQREPFRLPAGARRGLDGI